MSIKTENVLETLYSDFETNINENLEVQTEEVDEDLIVNNEPRTFNSIAKDDDILQM